MTYKGIGECRAITLTQGLDVIPGLIGSAGTAGNSGSDSIYGSASNVANTNTFTAGDNIDGGAGKDSLFLTLDGGSLGVMPAASIKNVENFFIRNVSGVPAVTTFDFANVAGEEQVWNDRSTSGVTVTNLAAGTTVGVKGNGTVTAATTASYVAAASAANIVVDGGTATGSGALTVENGAGLTAATIASTGAANTLGGIAFGPVGNADNIKTVTIDATTNLTTGGITGVAADTTITVKGAGAVNLGAVANNVKEVNAADNAGGVTLTMNNVATTKYVGSTGNDVITTGGVALTTGSVDAGAGTADRLVVAVNTDVDTKAKGDKYAGFEVLQVNNHAAGNIVNVENLATNNSITAIRIDDGANATGVTNLNATQAANVTIVNGNSAGGAITIGVKGAETAGQTDTVKASLLTTTLPANTANPINLTGITLAGVEKLELTGNGTVAGTTGAVTLTTTAATALDSIKLANVANGNSITIAAGQTGTNLNVDVTGSGNTTVDAMLYNTTTGATITGGAGNDQLFGSQRADIIKGGAGDDLIRGEAVAVTTQAARGQITDITLAATYDAGDVVSVTFGGNTYSHTVVAGSLTAANVWTGLQAATGSVSGVRLDAALAAANITVTNPSGTTYRWTDADTGTAAGYTVTAATNNGADVAVSAATQTLTLAAHPADGVTDTISVNVGGNTYNFQIVDVAGVETLAFGAGTTQPALLTALNAASISLSASDGTGNVVITGNTSGAALNLVQFASSSNATPGVSLASTAATGLPTDQANPTVNVFQTALDAVNTTNAVAHASDELWGGDGKDTFEFYKGANLTQIDTIKDLNLGTNVAAGQADVLKFQTTGSPTVTLVELSTSQAATVTGKATFAEAVNAALAVVNGLGNVAQFTYGASNDTYVVFNGDGNGTFDANSDYVVKITGVVGTLDASDIAVFAV